MRILDSHYIAGELRTIRWEHITWQLFDLRLYRCLYDDEVDDDDHDDEVDEVDNNEVDDDEGVADDEVQVG